jgi:glyoxylase-like metal-dependent hydrolase (beta-lactamase superfamily II)
MTLTGTNTWVLPAPGGDVVIDPGPDIPAHLRALQAQTSPAAVLITHGHSDHVAALAALPPDVPVHAADPRIARGTEPISDDRRLRVAGIAVHAIPTPGHTADSVSFVVASGKDELVATGDALLGGRRSAIVSRHSGSIGAQLSSLATLSRLAGRAGLPGHGDRITDVAAAAAAELSHRRRRLDELAALIEAYPAAGVDELTRRRHRRPPASWEAAWWMTEAESAYLRGEPAPRLELVPPGRLRDTLVDAVVRGVKTATSRLAVLEDLDGVRPEPAGTLLRLVDSSGGTAAIVEITRVQDLALGEVDDDIAQAEGDWFADVAQWRDAHERYWSRSVDEIRRRTGRPEWELNDESRVVVRRFVVVQPSLCPSGSADP